MRPHESLHRHDVKDIGFEEPAPELWFDPKRDVTEDDWRLLRKPFNIKTSMPLTFTLTECAATMRLLDPGLRFSSEDLGKPPQLIEQWRSRHFSEAAIYHLSNPDWSPDISDEVWDSMIANNLASSDYFGPSAIHIGRNGYADFAYIAAHFRILRPDADLNISNESWQSIQQGLDLDRRAENPRWAAIARLAANIRILNPRTEFHFTEPEIEHMREELGKRRAKSKMNWLGHIENYTDLLRSMCIISASDVQVTDRGVICEWKPPAKQPKKSDPFPEVKKY